MSSKILSWRTQCFKAQQTPEKKKPPSETQWMFLLDCHIPVHTSISAWIYENWVSKHFVDCYNFPCLSLFTVLFAYVILFYLTFFGVGWGHCFVVRDLCESGHGGNFMNLHSFYPPPLSPLSLSVSFPKGWFSVPTQNSLLQVTVIWNQCT